MHGLTPRSLDLEPWAKFGLYCVGEVEANLEHKAGSGGSKQGSLHCGATAGRVRELIYRSDLQDWQ